MHTSLMENCVMVNKEAINVKQSLIICADYIVRSRELRKKFKLFKLTDQQCIFLINIFKGHLTNIEVN